MDSPLKIYSGSNDLLYTTPINTGCRRKVQLMTEDSITVKFSDKSRIVFPVGSRIVDFYTTEEQQGKYNANTDAYDYELKLSAYYWLWANKLLFYVMPDVTNAQKETSFSLTATIDVHAAIILRALNNLGYKYNGSPFRIDTDSDVSSEAKYIQYSNMSILGGIQAIAEAYECEWWVESNAIHFGKCHALGEYDFTVGDNVSAITPSGTSKKGNRLYVFGSDRNLPPNYRAVNDSDVVDAIVTRRLMLPAGTPYLQIAEDIPEDQIVEEEVVFDKVYPRTQLTVTDVTTYTSRSEDGKTQTFFRIKYGNSFPFLKEYILPDKELHIVFESGDLNGMDFAVKFNPLGVGEKMDDGSINPEAQMFEIVINEDYGRELPDSILHPEKDDKFSLYGWNATKMEALGLIAAAEQELLAEGQKEVEERKKDLTTYTCPMMWDWCKDHAANMPLLGSVVNLHFAAGDTGRKSRVIGFEHDLDIPYSNVTYTCGEKVSASRLKTLESKVEGLTHDGTKVKIQNSLDFLSKRYSDRTPYRISADQGFEAGNFVSGLYNGKGGAVDGDGSAQFESLEVRSYMKVLELIVNRLSAIEGDQVLTEADTIDLVETARDEDGNPRTDQNGNPIYVLYLREKWDGYFTAQTGGSVIRGIINTLAGGSGDYYTSWMRIDAVNTSLNAITVTMYADDDTPAGKNFPPCAGMKIARWGHETDKMRQSCLYLSSTEGRIVKLTGVTKPILEEWNYGATFGTVPEFLRSDPRLGDLLDPDHDYVFIDGLIARDILYYDKQGRPMPEYVDRGPWDVASTYYCEAVNPDTGVFETSEVWCFGCKYRCMKTGTHATPGWGTTDWAMIEGNPNFSIDFAEHELYWRGDTFNGTLTLIATIYNQDITAKVSAANIQWTRESYDASGNRRVGSDNAWTAQTSTDRKQLLLTIADLDWDGVEGSISKVSFCCKVTIDDSQVATAQMDYEF